MVVLTLPRVNYHIAHVILLKYANIFAIYVSEEYAICNVKLHYSIS